MPEGVDIGPLRKIEETLDLRRAVGEICLQNTLDSLRCIRCLHVTKQFARDGGIGPKPAADQQMIAIDGIALIIDRDARADQPDIADVVLCA